MSNSIRPIIAELERIYDALATEFKLKHPRPLITLQTHGRQKDTLGWYAKNRWKLENKEIGEINICAESLNKTPVETLVHEMAHYANCCEDIPDCNSQQYHNKAFKTRAESYGLNVTNGDRRGWAYTAISPKLEAILTPIKIDYKVFKLYRKPAMTHTAPTKMKKFRCKCTIVRCATELNAKCLTCQSEFEEQE